MACLCLLIGFTQLANTIAYSLVAQRLKCLPAMQETWVRSLGREDPLEKEMANPLQYSCLENPMDGEACRLQSMVGYSLWGCKEWHMTE